MFRGAPERIDRLGIVAHHHHAAPVRLHAGDDRRLQAVGVLVLVDQHMVEQVAQFRPQLGVGRHLRPEQQKVVVVEHVLFLLGIDVGAEQRLQFCFPFVAPREGTLQYQRQRVAAVDHARIDRQAGSLQRETLLGLGQADVVPHHAHQVLGVAAVVDGERLFQADAAGVLAQQARADAVEGAGPRQAGRRLAAAQSEHAVQHAAGAVRHLAGGAPRERQQQDALRIGAALDQPRHPVRQRVGLAGPGAGNHQQRPRHAILRTDVVLDGGTLLAVQAGIRVIRGDRDGNYGHGMHPNWKGIILYIRPVVERKQNPGILRI